MESLGGPSTSLSDLLGAIPLVLKVSHLRVPVFDFIWDSIEGHDPFHERGGDSGSKEADQDIVASDASTSSVTLKCRNVTLERRGKLPILFDHVMGGQPGNGIPSSVLVFESQLELLKEVVPGSKGYGSAVDSILPEGFSPGLGGSFGHVQESEGDFLRIITVRRFVDCKVELDGVHPGDCCFVGAIEGLGLAELKLSWFDSG